MRSPSGAEPSDPSADQRCRTCFSIGTPREGAGWRRDGERVRLAIDGVDGRVHHLEMDPARAEEVRRGMIVAAGSSQANPCASDRNILAIAGKEGIYRPARHLEQAVGTVERLRGDPAAYVRSHIRRLEALRRAGHVERIDANQWRVPADLSARGQAYDLARDRTMGRITVLSPTDRGFMSTTPLLACRRSASWVRKLGRIAGAASGSADLM